MAATILLVDDSPIILMAIGDILSKAGFAVVKATSGEEALSKLQNGYKPDLMIADLNMAAMSGIELIGHARKSPGMRTVPMLMLTAESEQDSRNEAKSVGANGWIVKPVDVGALMKVVRQFLPPLERTTRQGSSSAAHRHFSNSALI
jgi:two-component system chemotaxis response regulator CheY